MTTFITSRTFTLTDTDDVIRSDGARIPADPDNMDYAEYLAWVGAGNTPDPYVPVVPVVVAPTLSDLQVQLAALTAQIALLASTT